MEIKLNSNLEEVLKTENRDFNLSDFEIDPNTIDKWEYQINTIAKKASKGVFNRVMSRKKIKTHSNLIKHTVKNTSPRNNFRRKKKRF